MKSALVVDDTAVTERLTYLLEQAGLRVAVSTSGPEALTRIEFIRPDVVLLEWQLPATDGLAVCAADAHRCTDHHPHRRR